MNINYPLFIVVLCWSLFFRPVVGSDSFEYSFFLDENLEKILLAALPIKDGDIDHGNIKAFFFHGRDLLNFSREGSEIKIVGNKSLVEEVKHWVSQNQRNDFRMYLSATNLKALSIGFSKEMDIANSPERVAITDLMRKIDNKFQGHVIWYPKTEGVYVVSSLKMVTSLAHTIEDYLLKRGVAVSLTVLPHKLDARLTVQDPFAELETDEK